MATPQKKKPNPEQHQLEEHQTVTFSNRDFDTFLEAIESDEEPNDALKQAAECYQQQFGGHMME